MSCQASSIPMFDCCGGIPPISDAIWTVAVSAVWDVRHADLLYDPPDPPFVIAKANSVDAKALIEAGIGELHWAQSIGSWQEISGIDGSIFTPLPRSSLIRVPLIFPEGMNREDFPGVPYSGAARYTAYARKYSIVNAPFCEWLTWADRFDPPGQSGQTSCTRINDPAFRGVAAFAPPDPEEPFPNDPLLYHSQRYSYLNLALDHALPLAPACCQA